jgi:CMP-N,N'-diacetyllegionaminic acid synthase
VSGRVVGIVPARAGSKGIPDKNLRLLAGKPLLAYAAEAARASGVIDRLVLSTDSAEIAALGESLGLEVPFMRPPELAQDDSPMQPVIAHALEQLESEGWRADVAVILQPTAPLRTGAHIVRALEILRSTGSSSVASVVRIPEHFAPQYAMRLDGDSLRPYLAAGERITRRQDTEPAFSRDGTVYAVRRDVVLLEGDLYGSDCRPLEVPIEESVNLDTAADWDAAEARLS